MQSVKAVIEFLEAEQARGKTHVLLDEDARSGLRELYLQTKTGAAPAASASPSPPRGATANPSPVVREEAPKATTSRELRVSGSTKQEQLASLRQQAANWAPAMALGTLRETMVFATGNPEATLMLVGEAPGYEEERKQEPFVGPAGQKLNDILKAMGLARNDVYISNIVKFRPATARQTTNNRKPTPKEMAACLPFVREEIKIVQPTCIVALGGTAAEGLLGLADSVTSMRGSWHEFDGIPVRVSYHPSYLLRSQSDMKTKRMVWEDMLTVMEKLEMPVSGKQRGFFLPKD